MGGGLPIRRYHGDLREILTGLWHWQAPHPDWTPDEQWPQLVSSCAIDDGARLILVDPLAVPDEVLGHTLVDFGRGLQVNDSLRVGVVRGEVAERLRLILDRPIAAVLSAHGGPTDGAALELALS